MIDFIISNPILVPGLILAPLIMGFLISIPPGFIWGQTFGKIFPGAGCIARLSLALVAPVCCLLVYEPSRVMLENIGASLELAFLSFILGTVIGMILKFTTSGIID